MISLPTYIEGYRRMIVARNTISAVFANVDLLVTPTTRDPKHRAVQCARHPDHQRAVRLLAQWISDRATGERPAARGGTGAGACARERPGYRCQSPLDQDRPMAVSIYGEVGLATLLRQLTTTSIGTDGPAGTRLSMSSRPSGATSYDGS